MRPTGLTCARFACDLILDVFGSCGKRMGGVSSSDISIGINAGIMARGRASMFKWKMLWATGKPFKQSFAEVRLSTASVYESANAIVRTSQEVPDPYQVRMGKIPREAFSLRKNIFSTLFQSMYHLLDVEYERRILFGQLNCLFRIWVTSADNLLDNERKIVLPLIMKGEAGVMQQIISVMTADRVMETILTNSRKDGLLTEMQAASIRDKSLQVLLPSAAQEAAEEAGVGVRPKPDEILSVIHAYKTGVLFHIPFLGPDVVGGVDLVRMAELKKALFLFGMGCQLLDDIRDLARDFCEQRQNYLLSWLYHEQPDILGGWEKKEIKVEDRLYKEVPQVVIPTVKLAVGYMRDAWGIFGCQGLAISDQHVDQLAGVMFEVLDLKDIAYHA